MSERAGVFGGTFDPVHYGHLRAAEEMAEFLSLDRVLFVPAAQHPHKSPDGPVDFKHRLKMVKLAIDGRPGFEALDIEKDLPLPSYTVNTLKAILKLEKKAQVFFLVGYDSFRLIQKWTGYRELLSLAPFGVFRRPGGAGGFNRLKSLLTEIYGSEPAWDPEGSVFVCPFGAMVHYYEGCRLRISSTDLRARLFVGDSVRYLLPEKVRAYLTSRDLYSPKN
jgi:nicotinate-nucleotide adenylyltransferase